ncbi:MAG: tRNA (guanosine(46)-N7)-methyltransferase TrmB [Alphaproteobacteria bacterium]|nr:tRNA (guanosine(46)-N7)-methyltransferase TrmB [Alphaproteobacteria bacterium]
MSDDPSQPSPFLRSYGRRRGRKLSENRMRTLDGGLARWSVPPGDAPLDRRTLFARPLDALWLEIGFGGGEHLAAQAAANPDVGLIGCEPFVDGVAALCARLDAAGRDNVRIWPDDARPLIARLPDGSVARAFILFPDPWPKARHHKRRLIQADFLDLLARVLAPGAELRVATDDPAYLEHIVAVFAAHPAFALPAGAEGRRPADAPETRYEAKARAAGRSGTYLRYRRLAPSA